ncbi:MAG: UDP-4-amino-4,6-dideoxy-N-acetyl-beta-L-altrosamine N-acetyltransferase [Sulfurimonas sp.]
MILISLEKFGSFSLTDFTSLNSKEKEMVLKWRNHSDIKKWMYNKEDISLKNHLDYIENLKECSDKKYFLVKQGTEYIGVVDFMHIDYNKEECEFGLYANPFDKIVGIGRILEELCIEYVFSVLKLKKLKLEVLIRNEKALNLYKKYNFKEVGTKEINGNEVICMELVK